MAKPPTSRVPPEKPEIRKDPEKTREKPEMPAPPKRPEPEVKDHPGRKDVPEVKDPGRMRDVPEVDERNPHPDSRTRPSVDVGGPPGIERGVSIDDDTED